MNSRSVKIVAAAILLLIGAAGLLNLQTTYTVSLTEQDIQDKISLHIGRDIPITGAGQYLLKSMHAEKVACHIQDGQVNFLVNAAGVFATGKDFGITAFARGAPRYEQGEFFFDPKTVEIRSIAYDRKALGDTASKLGRMLKNETIQKAIENKIATLNDWENAAAQRIVGQVLASHPVYRLKSDVKGLLIRSALESVAVADDKIIVTFSLWSLTITVAFGASCLLAAAVLIGLIVRRQK